MLILVSIPTVIVELYMQFDDPKWKFLGGLCLLIVLVSEVIPVVKINIILFKPIRKAVAYSLAMQSSQENEKGLDVEAIKKIKVACDLDPEEPRHWLMFSVLERTRDTKKAKECLAIAENLVKEKGMRSKKIIAWMEFIKGNLILTEHGSRELALKHYKESLELDYDKERAEFIQKVANYSVKKEGVSNKKSVVSL
ncbi:MAG: hypothetical protein H8E62_02795 [Planctomycetes bacterium]|nr:hypothetical protein [Planctomycetota bacterium]